MPAKITRVELIIIVAALVVLLFSNRPPKSGNADVRMDTNRADTDVQIPIPQAQYRDVQSPEIGQSALIPTGSSELQGLIVPRSDNPTMESIPQPQPKPKRIAVVDARKCDSLQYPNVMYGEVSVTRVWNGTDFEWRKVCRVIESNGTVTVWSFDDRHEGVTITELPPDQVPTN